MKRRNAILCFFCSACLVLSGCSSGGQEKAFEQTKTEKKEASIIQVDTSAYDLDYSDRDKNSTYEESSSSKIDFSAGSISGDGVSITDGVATIRSAGTYVVSGTSTNGQIKVEAAEGDKVQIVLAGVNLTCESGPCINVVQADKVFVTLASGTENVLSDGSNFSIGDEDELDATVYSKSDITFNGQGSLTVNATVSHAIHSKDDLVITGGVYNISSTKSGLLGKDCVKIDSGTFNITSQTDCIKSNNTDDEGRGFVYINGGTLTLKSTDKGIQASKLVCLAGGDITVESEDDTVHSDSFVKIDGANLTLSAGDDAVHANDQLEIASGYINVAKCYEGLEAYEITISGGEVNITATDDGINAAQSNSSSDVTDDENGDAVQDQNAENAGNPPEKPSGDNQNADGGNGQPQNPQDGSNADGQTQDRKEPPQNGSTDNGNNQPPSGGENPQGGDANNSDNSQQNRPNDDSKGPGGGGGGGEGPGTNQGASLAITGGTVKINVQSGDGLDANGSILMSGGRVTVTGPSNDGNSSLDYDGYGTITGGSFMAIGSSGMAQSFGETSSQASVVLKTDGKNGDVVSVADESGTEIISLTSTCDYSYIEASDPNLTEGTTYKVFVNGIEVGTAEASSNQSSGIAQGSDKGGGGKQGGGSAPSNSGDNQNTEQNASA